MKSNIAFYLFLLLSIQIFAQQLPNSNAMSREEITARKNQAKTYAALMECLKKNNISAVAASKRSKESSACDKEIVESENALKQFNDEMAKVKAFKGSSDGSVEHAKIDEDYTKKSNEDLSKIIKGCTSKQWYSASRECQSALREDKDRRIRNFETYSDTALQDYLDSNCGLKNFESLKIDGPSCEAAGFVKLKKQINTKVKRNENSKDEVANKPNPKELKTELSSLSNSRKKNSDALLGVDSNNDGLCDDIENYIKLKYPDSSKARMALTSFAKGMQKAILAENKESANLAHTLTTHAMDCLMFLYGLNSNKMWQELRAEILNTRDRSLAYLEYSKLLSGGAFQLTPPDKQKSNCEVSPDTLPN